jgi:hypothetical protein
MRVYNETWEACSFIIVGPLNQGLKVLLPKELANEMRIISISSLSSAMG